MARVVLHAEAEHELEQALLYYGAIDEALGLRLFALYEDKLRLIGSEPELFSVRLRETRRVNLDPFPYYLAYLYDAAADTVWVLAVGHSARRPYYWRHRKAE